MPGVLTEFIIYLSMQAVIGQICRPYSTVQLSKFESFLSCVPN